MKIRLSDYVAVFLATHGITHVFSVVGGGAMFLNDALGHHRGLRCIYNHHEQACAIAAEAYARVENKIAAVCVTTGPGGTNAITGVLCGWLDSIPMLVISGQVKVETSARSTGLPLRAMGDQEYDIVRCVEAMTKYSEMVVDPRRIRYCLEKALYLARQGRPGPCWLDIPLDVQGALIDPDDLPGYSPEDFTPPVSEETALAVIEKIRGARRPVLYAGNGIRLSGGYELFLQAAEALGVPVVTCWNSVDLIWDEHPLYAGRAGSLGGRPGNFAVQNSDLVLAVGNRLNLRQIGQNWKGWARAAYKIMVDIDPAELHKPTIQIDMPIYADAKDFFRAVLTALSARREKLPLFRADDWVAQCQRWNRQYPVVLPRHYEQGEKANVYCFLKEISRRLPEGQISVLGTTCLVASHSYEIKPGQRYITSAGAGTLGYDLPAAIGVCFAQKNSEVILITGEGSLQMNLQELQTIVHHRLPIKIFVVNNDGYHSIRQTQRNVFPESSHVGIGLDSGDLSFPALDRLAQAYRIPYVRIGTNREMALLDTVLARPSFCLCEVVVSTEQVSEPKLSVKRLPDGTLYSPALEDLAPFLPREELLENMYIPLLEDDTL